MRTNKLLAGALVCLLSLSAITSCGKEEPKAPAPTQQTADRLINRVHIDSSVYMQAVQDFVLPTSVQDGDAVYPISWTSDNEINAKIVDVKKTDKDGKEYVEKTVKIVRPKYDKDAESQGVAYTLTAELTTGEFKQTKKFSGYVMMMENLLRVSSVNDIYEDMISESHDPNRPYFVSGYIVYADKDGFYVRSSETDKPIYVYGFKIMSEKGLEVNDKVTVQGKVEARDGVYQFSHIDVIVNPVNEFEPKELGMPSPKDPIDLAALCAMNAEQAKALAYNKLTLKGTVKQDDSGKHPAWYIQSADGKYKVVFNFYSSPKALYEQLKELVGQEKTFDVIYHGSYAGKTKHTVDLIAIK